MLLSGVLLIGFISGLICWLILPQRKSAGLNITILTGIIGAVMATFTGEVIGLYQPSLKNGLIVAVPGALVLIIVNKLLSFGKRKSEIVKKTPGQD